MTAPTILLVSYHFHPSPEVGAKRPSQTARFLQARGYRLIVCRGVARPVDDPQQEPDFATIDFISVPFPRKRLTSIWKRIRTAFAARRRARSGLRHAPPSAPAGDGAQAPPRRLGWMRRQLRALDSFLQGDKLWLLSGLARALWRLRGQDVDLVVASGPPIAGYVCGLFVARWLKTRLLLDFRDPWYLHGDPERKTQIVGHPLAKLENRLGQYCVSASSAIVVSSPGIENHLREAFSIDDQVISLVRNGYEEDDVIDEPPPRGRLTMLYAGTLYWNRNPFPFLEALQSVCESPDVTPSKVQFRLVGRCAEWNGVSLDDWILQRGLRDVVTVAPPIDREQLRKLVIDSNVLVNFAQGQARQIPAKSYEYIASGRPVLTLAERDSAVARLFAEAGSGEVVEPADIAGIRRAIMDFYGHFVSHTGTSGGTAEIDGFSRACQLERFEAVVETCLGTDVKLHRSV